GVLGRGDPRAPRLGCAGGRSRGPGQRAPRLRRLSAAGRDPMAVPRGALRREPAAHEARHDRRPAQHPAGREEFPTAGHGSALALSGRWRPPRVPPASCEEDRRVTTTTGSLTAQQEPLRSTKYIYFFGENHTAEGNAGMKALLGGKGAGLAEMTNAGVPVPPGFTITTEVCRWYYAHERTLPPAFERE